MNVLKIVSKATFSLFGVFTQPFSVSADQCFQSFLKFLFDVSFYISFSNISLIINHFPPSLVRKDQQQIPWCQATYSFSLIYSNGWRQNDVCAKFDKFLGEIPWENFSSVFQHRVKQGQTATSKCVLFFVIQIIYFVIQSRRLLACTNNVNYHKKENRIPVSKTRKEFMNFWQYMPLKSMKMKIFMLFMWKQLPTCGDINTRCSPSFLFVSAVQKKTSRILLPAICQSKVNSPVIANGLFS